MAKTVKARVEKALISLTENMDIEKITVSTLIRECGISRSLFYYYYQDIGDVVDQMISSRLEKITSECLKIQDARSSVDHFVQQYADVLPILRRVHNTRYYEKAEEHISRILEGYLREVMYRKAGDKPIVISDAGFVTDFMSSAITAYFFRHDSDPEPDIPAVSHYLYRMITAVKNEF